MVQVVFLVYSMDWRPDFIATSSAVYTDASLFNLTLLELYVLCNLLNMTMPDPVPILVLEPSVKMSILLSCLWRWNANFCSFGV